MAGSAKSNWYVHPWQLRWKGYRRWHRVRLGPACASFYVYPRGENLGWRGTRLCVSGISWVYVDSGGTRRHANTFRRWRKQRAAVAARTRQEEAR